MDPSKVNENAGKSVNRPTLAEWSESARVRPVRLASGCMVVPDRDYPDRGGPWRLADYAVSSVSAGSIFLCPIPSPSPSPSPVGWDAID